jgi:hypothetical protein
MSDTIRDAGFFVAVGILLAVLVIGGIAAAGFKIPALRFPAFASNRGTLTLQVTDKPAELEHLNITIDKLSIQQAQGDNETWTDLELIDDKPIYFDLLALQNVSLTLSKTEIPAGNYTMIKMHVLTANATKPDGTIIDSLRVPSENIKVLLKPHLIMQSGSAITVTIDLEPETAQIAISHSLNLKPTMKAMVNT